MKKSKTIIDHHYDAKMDPKILIIHIQGYSDLYLYSF
jgi:hypothetical protein